MKRILALSSLLAIALATIGCGFSSAPPDHAQFIEEDSWLVVTAQPGQIMEKLDYETFVQSPLYSEFDKDVTLFMNVLNLDEPEKTGVDWDEPVYFFMKGTPDNKLTFQAGVSFALSDVKDFDDLIDTVINFAKREGVDLTLKQDEDLRIVTVKDSKLPVHLLYDEDKAFLAVGYHNPKRKFLEPEGLDDHSSVVQAHLERSFDLGAVLDFSNFTSAMRGSGDRDMEKVGAMFSAFEGGGIAYELSAEDGELLLKTFSSFGATSLAEDVVADSVGSDLLEVIPNDAIAAAALSMNLNAAVDAFLPTLTELATLGNNGELPPGFPRDVKDKLPNVGFSLDDLTTAIPGEFSAALIELNGNDAPEFVVAIKTADVGSAAYKKVISNNPMIGMLKENLQGEGIRFEEKDNLILLASAGQSSILRNAAATNPVSGDKEDLLDDGYAGLWLDVDALVEDLPAPRGDDVKLLMKALRKLDLLSMEAEVDDEVFISTFKITFKDDDVNALRQIAESIEEIVRQNERMLGDQAEIEAVKGLKTLHNTMLGAKPPIKTFPTAAELVEISPAGFAAWFHKRTGFTNNDVWYVKYAEDVIELSANDNEKGGLPNQIAKSTGDFHPDFNAAQKEAISWEMCIPTDAAKQKTLRDLKRTGEFPVIWTKGLQSDGTWERNSPWDGAGGHVLFSDGTIKWFETAEDQFVNAQSEEKTSDVEQAIPEGWLVLKSY